MIIGADIGYFNTKYVTKDHRGIFTSVVDEDTLGLNKAMCIELNNKIYSIGSTGTFASDSNKINDINFKLCLYSAIADSMRVPVDNSVKLVTGLPIAYYSKQKDSLRENLMNKMIDLTFTKSGVEQDRTFVISDVIVFPQSAGLLIIRPDLFSKNAYNIVIDIGGYTTDVSLFKGKELIRFRTFQKGMIKLNGLIRSHLSTYGLDMPIMEVSDLIAGPNFVNNIVKNSDIVTIIEKYLTSIISDIKIEFTEYPYSTKTYIGGGSKDLEKYINGDVVAESIFVNAEAFYKLGISKW